MISTIFYSHFYSHGLHQDLTCKKIISENKIEVQSPTFDLSYEVFYFLMQIAWEDYGVINPLHKNMINSVRLLFYYYQVRSTK